MNESDDDFASNLGWNEILRRLDPVATHGDGDREGYQTI